MIQLKDQEHAIIELILSHGGALEQNKLPALLGISRSAVLKHIHSLESDKKLVKRNLTAQIGGAKQYRITINPDRLQEIRSICGKPSGHYTLLSGAGKYNPPVRITQNNDTLCNSNPPKSNEEPAIALTELLNSGYFIKKVIIYGTPESGLDQTIKLMPENLRLNTIIKQQEFSEFQSPESNLLSRELFDTIRQELVLADLIFDLTPLTKPWTIKLLDYAKNFGIPAFYLAQTPNAGADEPGVKIIWINLPERDT